MTWIFLNKIPNKFAEHECLVTLDVSNMYTNIDNDLGLCAIQYWLQQHPELLMSNLQRDLIIEALYIILKYNAFTSNETDYVQTRGTAMGTKVAPTYITRVMGYLENTRYDTIESSQIYLLLRCTEHNDKRTTRKQIT